MQRISSGLPHAIQIGVATLAGLAALLAPAAAHAGSAASSAPGTKAAAAAGCSMQARIPYRWVLTPENQIYAGTWGEIRCSAGVASITLRVELYRGDILVGRNEHTALGPVAPGVPLTSLLVHEDVLCVPGTYHAEVAGSTSTGFSDFISTASATVTC